MMLKSDFIKDSEVITQGFSEALLGPISHDLTIQSIISDKEKKDNISISPGETFYIECEQVINLPNNLIGFVHNKNSRIRQGLNLVSPIYQPGHHTRVFFRITNISSDMIYLKKGDKIGQISFEEVKGNTDIKYNGEFQDEMDFKGLGKYDSEYTSKKIENKIKTLEEIEKKIYLGVASIFTVLISVFGFLNTGFKLQNNESINTNNLFASLSLSLIVVITLLFGIIGLLFSKKTVISWILVIIGLLAFTALFSLSSFTFFIIK